MIKNAWCGAKTRFGQKRVVNGYFLYQPPLTPPDNDCGPRSFLLNECSPMKRAASVARITRHPPSVARNDHCPSRKDEYRLNDDENEPLFHLLDKYHIS